MIIDIQNEFDPPYEDCFELCIVSYSYGYISEPKWILYKRPVEVVTLEIIHDSIEKMETLILQLKDLAGQLEIEIAVEAMNNMMKGDSLNES